MEWSGLVRIKRGHDYFFTIAENMIAKHEEAFVPGNVNDFTDYFINERINTSNYPGKEFAHLHLKNIYLNLFFAGNETTSSTLRWCLLFMLLHPEERQQVQASSLYKG